MCWNVVVQLGVSASEEESKNSEWVSTTNEKMIEKVKDFKIPYGKMGDLFDATPKRQIRKVFLEDIVYETWYHSRSVLIGDGNGLTFF